MNTTLSEQIAGIQEMRRTIKVLVENGLIGTDNASRMDSLLNDAGSTIAALNLSQSRESNAKLIGIVNPDQSRDMYFEELYLFFESYINTESKDIEERLKEKILNMAYDRIKELELQLSFYADKN